MATKPSTRGHAVPKQPTRKLTPEQRINEALSALTEKEQQRIKHALNPIRTTKRCMQAIFDFNSLTFEEQSAFFEAYGLSPNPQAKAIRVRRWIACAREN